MSDIYAKAEQGDTQALSELLGILYDSHSPELYVWTKKALSFDANNRIFLNYMGICYASGMFGSEKNIKKAKEYYQKAAELGFCTAADNLANILLRENDAEALAWAQKAYELGADWAAITIAEIYLNGCGVEKDELEAFKWYYKGAEAGETYAQTRVGLMKLEGKGCQADLSEAVQWLQTAAEGGNAEAASALSQLYRENVYCPRDLKEAEYWALEAMRKDDSVTDALSALLEMYKTGDTVEPDMQKLLELCCEGARTGNIKCMENVGILCSEDEYRLTRDIDKAIYYYEMAGEKGSDKAIRNLRMVYREKYPESYNEYYVSKLNSWAQMKNAAALTMLGQLYGSGDGVEVDIELSKKYMKEAAALGNSIAQRCAGTLYEQENPALAEQYFKSALQNGNLAAKFNLGRLYVTAPTYELEKKVEGIRLLKEVTDPKYMPEALYLLSKCEPDKGWKEKAAEAGYGKAIFELAFSAYIEERDGEAVKWARAGIKQENPGCMNIYADLLALGRVKGESPDEQAYIYYQKTAEKGNFHGALCAGNSYLFGRGGAERNIKKAISYFEQAVQIGSGSDSGEAKKDLADAYFVDDKVKYADQIITYYKDWLSVKENEEYPEYNAVVFRLSIVYEEISQNEDAFELLKMAADRPDCSADILLELAALYMRDAPEKTDDEKALELVNKVEKLADLDEDTKKYAEELKEIALHNLEVEKNRGTTVCSGSNVTYRPNGQDNTSSGGCYIATCVYGSYDCPSVWVLRRFRDYTLAETMAGRAFIQCYYKISPWLVAHFGQKKWFRYIWLRFLNRQVRQLKEKGVSDQRYTDRNL